VRWIDPPGLYAITLGTPALLALKAGGATVGGSVALALGAGLLVGTAINELVFEPYIAEPIFDMIWPEGSPTDSPYPYPHPQPQPDPNLTDQETDEEDCELDDFGRLCRKEEMQKVIVVAISTSGHILEHASINVAGRTEGWHFVNPRDVVRVQRRGQYDYIAPGEVRDDSELLFSAPFISQTYDACPESVGVVEARINSYRSGGNFNLLNLGARNCAGWVCQVLQEANIHPKPPKKLLYTPSPATCETPGLRPIHLTPGGLTEPLVSIPTLLSE
jgi:hypothetical protein